MVADSSDNTPKSNGGEEKERTAGQFFHIGEQGEQGDASAKVGVELHPLDYWVLDTGTASTMTPHKELLDGVRAAPINEVCSASGHVLKVAGAGRAAFKGADGKPVVLHDVLLVPDLKANLISLRKLAKAGVSTSTDGARTYKRQLGNRVLWDLHESKDVYRSIWQLPALAWHGGGQAGEGSASLGECDAVGGVGVKVSARSGETDWATAHRLLEHEDWLPFVEKQAGCVVKRIRTDRGGEFLGAEMMAWLKKQGIQRELTTAYTPQSNGVAEWANRTILETARVLLIESGVGNSMWPHAIRHATVARNRVLTKSPTSPRSIEVSWGRVQSVCGRRERRQLQRGDGEKVQEAPAGGGGGVEASGSTSGAAGPKGEQQQGKAKAPTLPQRRKPKGVVMKGWETPVSRPGRTRMATMKLTAGADVAEQQLGNEEALLIIPHGNDPDEEDEPAYYFLAPAPEEPASMEEALAGPDKEKWLVSRDAKYQSLLDNGTWDLVVLPEGKKAVQCKWVLRIKIDDKRQVTIYKSRLVAKGFMQKEKQDFNEIFAPTAKPPTLRVLLADAAVSGKFIIQMDISTAFLNGILEDDVYMAQPPGYEDGTGMVCKLKRYIYSLKQEPRCWYQKLAAVLEEMGFRTSSCDESLFLKGEGEKLVLFLVYVNDILLFSSSMKEIQKVQ
ncbi:unnamed protein product [Closterium sp. NIES-53]